MLREFPSLRHLTLSWGMWCDSYDISKVSSHVLGGSKEFILLRVGGNGPNGYNPILNQFSRPIIFYLSFNRLQLNGKFTSFLQGKISYMMAWLFNALGAENANIRLQLCYKQHPQVLLGML